MPATCVCVRSRAFACVCVHLLPAMCVCVHSRAFVCVCVHLLLAACVCMRLHTIAGITQLRVYHLLSEKYGCIILHAFTRISWRQRVFACKLSSVSNMCCMCLRAFACICVCLRESFASNECFCAFAFVCMCLHAFARICFCPSDIASIRMKLQLDEFMHVSCLCAYACLHERPCICIFIAKVVKKIRGGGGSVMGPRL